MPAIVGAVNVNAVDGVFNIGDVGIISPTSYAKTYAGGGSFNTGNYMNVSNASSVINVYDSAIYDQTLVAPSFRSSAREEGPP